MNGSMSLEENQFLVNFDCQENTRSDSHTSVCWSLETLHYHYITAQSGLSGSREV